MSVGRSQRFKAPLRKRISMNESPLPAPEGKQCFNCGKNLEKEATFCPHCGAPLPTQGSGVSIVLRIIGLIILVGLALIFGAAGACFMIVSTGGLLGSGNSDELMFAGIGLVLLAVAALCVWGAVALKKKS